MNRHTYQALTEELEALAAVHGSVRRIPAHVLERMECRYHITRRELAHAKRDVATGLAIEAAGELILAADQASVERALQKMRGPTC